MEANNNYIITLLVRDSTLHIFENIHPFDPALLYRGLLKDC